MCLDETRTAVRTLFAAYRQTDKAAMDVYVSMLGDVPTGLLNKTIKKCICEQKYLPAIAEIRQAAQSLMGAVDPSRRTKTWEEAQREIQRGLSRTWFHGCLGEIPPDHPDYGRSCDPMWSTPEVAAAVNAYGLDNLCRVLEDDMPIVWAQLRRLYEQACQRKDDAAVNSYVLGDDATRLQQIVRATGLLEARRETID